MQAWLCGISGLFSAACSLLYISFGHGHKQLLHRAQMSQANPYSPSSTRCLL